VSRSALKLGGDVVDLYEQDYIKTWDGILSDVQLAPFGSPAETADALGVLSGPTSPLRGFFAVVSENTLLVQAGPPPPATGAAGAAEAATSALKKKLGQATSSALGGLFPDAAKASRTPGVLVTAHFQPIHRLMMGDPPPIDNILLRLGQVEQQLRTLQKAGRLEALSDPQLKDMLRSLQQEAAGMPPVIQSLAGQVEDKAEGTVVAGAASEVETRYLREVQRDCSQIVTGRYPFTHAASSDIPLRDFAYLFGYNSGYDKFFRENLEPLVDRSQSPWTWKSGAVAQAPRAILDQFERAQRIRDIFFKRSGELELKFFLTVAEADPSSIRFVLDIDGNKAEYKPQTPPIVAVWPGATPTTASVTWYERFGGQPRTPFTGAWAWFRLLDSAAQQQRENDTRTSFTFEMPGHRARVIVEASSLINNPFSSRDWRQFSCQY
jgi:type VI secretion system protein ImpL